MDQVKEKLIIEELQLQLADRAGVKISDAELNVTLTRLASNNQLTLEEFISYIEDNGDSYEEVREEMRKEMRIQRIQRGRVNSNIDITEKEFEAFLATDESLLSLQPELLLRQILVKDINTADKLEKLLKCLNSLKMLYQGNQLGTYQSH
jgi:peptidyl-prolyl cis-trans isomerase SurA